MDYQDQLREVGAVERDTDYLHRERDNARNREISYAKRGFLILVTSATISIVGSICYYKVPIAPVIETLAAPLVRLMKRKEEENKHLALDLERKIYIRNL